MTIEKFLIYHRDPFGVMTRVTQVPAKQPSAIDSYMPVPACSLRLIETAERVLGVDESGMIRLVLKDRAGGKGLKRAIRLLNQAIERQSAKKMAWAMALYDHLETFGVLIATREKSGHINIHEHGSFSVKLNEDGTQEWRGSTTAPVGRAVIAVKAGDTVEVVVE